MSRRTSRTKATAPTSSSTATPRCGWACRCRRSQDTLYDSFGPAPGFDDLRSGEPVSRDPGGRSGVATKSGFSQIAARSRHQRQRRYAGAAGRHRADRERHRAAWSSPIRNNSPPSRSVSIVAPGYSLGDAVDAVARAEHDIGMPETITGNWSGDAAEFRRSLASEPWLILAAVVVIYIVLGVLYESWIHPVTIISTLPSAGIGALAALMICGIDLSLVALVGHRAADGHREEERHHDGGLRARRAAPSGRRRPRTRSARPACCGSARS